MDFSSKKILLIGDVMLDHYVYGSALRLSPEAPVPVLKVEREEFRIGGAGTVLRNLSSLGAKTTFISVIGDDLDGNKVTHLVGDVKNCTPYLIQEKGRLTTVKTRYIAGHHQISRVDKETTDFIHDRTIQLILSKIETDYDAIIISDYAKGIITPVCQEIIKKAAGIPVIIDPKSTWFGLYSGAHIITPNLSELGAATDEPIKTTENINDRCRDMMANYNIKNILVTRGAEGMLLRRENGQSIVIPAVAKEVYDVTGAGDTVVAVLALAIASDMSLTAASMLANKAAGIVVGKMGSVAVGLEELCTQSQ